ncbi:MAG TPA: hypothetical protein VF384_17180 [Planctomycetota bacterium]
MDRTDEGADLPVIEMALAEELARSSPPDLWPRLQARLRGETRPRRWLVAALVLLGVAIVGGVALLAGDEPRSATPPDQRSLETDASGPESLGALQAMLDTVRRAKTRAHVVWSEEHGDWFALSRHPLEDWFANPSTRNLDDSLLDRLVAALAKATEAAAAPRRRVWQHSVELTFRKGSCRCLIAEEGNTFALGIASPHGLIPLNAMLPDAALRPLLEQSTRLTLDARGIAIGARGLDALSSECTKLRAYRVPSSAAVQLPRFTKVTSVEVNASPEWHSPAVLGQVARLPLRSLAVQGRLLDRNAVAAITSMTNLAELYLVGEDLWQSFNAPQQLTASALDDDAVKAIAAMRNLEEITLCGGACTDVGLAALAQLPRLRQLNMSGCKKVTGSGLQAFAQHALEELDLRGCDLLAVEHLGALASLPNLDTLCLGSPTTALDLRACPDLPQLTELVVDGRMAPDALATLSRFRGLTKLHLRLQPELRDADLAKLPGLTQLKHLYFVSTKVTDAAREAFRAALPQCSISREMW